MTKNIKLSKKVPNSSVIICPGFKASFRMINKDYVQTLSKEYDDQLTDVYNHSLALYNQFGEEFKKDIVEIYNVAGKPSKDFYIHDINRMAAQYGKYEPDANICLSALYLLMVKQYDKYHNDSGQSTGYGEDMTLIELYRLFNGYSKVEYAAKELINSRNEALKKEEYSLPFEKSPLDDWKEKMKEYNIDAHKWFSFKDIQPA